MKVGLLAERMRLGFGADLVHHEIATGLAERGHDVTVFTIHADGSYNNSLYRIVQLPIPASPFFPRYERNARRFLIELLAKDVDLFIVGTFPFFGLVPDLSRRVPCLVIEYGICSTMGFSIWRRLNFAYMRWTQYHRYFTEASAIVAISNFLKEQLPPRLQDKTTVIHLGADHYASSADLHGRRKEFRHTLGIADNDVLALYVGRINRKDQPYKGTAELVRVYHALQEKAPQARLMMVGYGNRDDEQWLRDAGVVPYLNASAEEMPVVYAASDLFVTASKWEGFDLPLAEAQYFGKPVLAYKVGAHAEVVLPGKTGALVADEREFSERFLELVCDRELREVWGSEGKQWVADRLPWSRAIEQYVALAERTAAESSHKKLAAQMAQVSVAIVNYNAPIDMLDRCLRSLLGQTYQDFEIILVDNCSTNGSCEWVEQRYPNVQVVRVDANRGFAYGINRGAEVACGRYLLVSNFDVEYTPTALAEMVKAIEMDERLAGVAPKTLLLYEPDIIDNVGTLLTPENNAFNMGIGQLDIGQYDRSEPVFGVCFAAALIRAHHFSLLGGLDESLFMYYEDVDWCFRANICGFRFCTAPTAVVYHVHSAATRMLDYSFKYELIQLNLLRMTLQNMQGRMRVARFFVRRLLSHLRTVILSRRWVRPTIRLLVRFALDVPFRLRRRQMVKKCRLVPDDDLWKWVHGEQPHFDPVSYCPIPSYDMLIRAYKRRYLLTGDPQDIELSRAITRVLEESRESKLSLEKDFVKGKVLHMLRNEPEHVRRYVERM